MQLKFLHSRDWIRSKISGISLGRFSRMGALPRDLSTVREIVEGRIFFPAALAAALVLLSSILSDGILSSEESAQGMLKAPAAAVQVRSSPRLRSQFLSQVEHYLMIRSQRDSIAAWLRADADLQAADPRSPSGGLLRSTVSIQLVSDNFFDYLGGSIVRGRAFNKSELMTEARVVVLSEKVVENITGDASIVPTEIFLSGHAFRVLGVWRINAPHLQEASSIWVPISMVPLFGDASRTTITKFVLPNSSPESLEALKTVIDRVQLRMGTGFTRPEFSWIELGASQRNSSIWRQKRGPLDVLAWTAIGVVLVLTYFAWDQALGRSQMMLLQRQAILRQPQRVLWSVLKPILGIFWLWIFLGLVAAMIVSVLIAPGRALVLDWSLGWLINLQMLLLVVGAPFTIGIITWNRIHRPIRWSRWLG